MQQEHRTNDLRDRAARLRGQLPPLPTDGHPPEDTGRRLATCPRGKEEELRISWCEYEGNPYLVSLLGTDKTLRGETINRRAVCGRSARTIRRGEGPNPIGPSYPYHGLMNRSQRVPPGSNAGVQVSSSGSGAKIASISVALTSSGVAGSQRGTWFLSMITARTPSAKS